MEPRERYRSICQDRTALSGLEDIKIENAIGFAKVPLGLAGPLQIGGLYQRSTVWAPLATVEATLVASCSRGCKVFQACGGVRAAALGEGMSRAPMFHFATVDDAVAFYRLAPTLEDRFRESASRTSRFARLVSVQPHIIANTVHLKFVYRCGDAAGQNMVTIATQRACNDFMQSAEAKAANITGYQIDGQFSSDKKLSWANVQGPRGVQVMAWATLTNEASERILKCSTTALDSFLTRLRDGAIRIGIMGNSVNTSNVMAAMFIACGQDVASVLEGGWSQLTHTLDPDTKALRFSLYFPSMPVGSVGGGTAYATQREALEMINCYGEGRKLALAETIASFCLALELSTAAALTNGTFSQAHERLARSVRTSKL